MRALAVDIIRAAGIEAGLPSDSIMDAPETDTLLLPRPRLEIAFMPEALTRSVKRIVKFSSIVNPGTHRTVRSRVYKRALTVRATVQADDEAWLDEFVVSFITALPAKSADADGNLVTVKAQRAVWAGFAYRMVEVFKKRSNAIHIEFSGMICRDAEIPLILDVNLKDGVTYEETTDG